MAVPQAPRPARPYLIVHTVASVDGRVSLGPGRIGFEDVGDEHTPHLFRGPELGPADRPASLELVSVAGQPSGRVRLHYRVTG